ncbi:MAG: hypothetical protein B7Z73_10350 [Planctomycetia bacterium 21-64-5]|nr:MAG: hypothetical protein B7Z73_10350 [Planctomycetia bacterium 21-64-5]HQU44476.1 hypothetical protein [Pirellulales bacterium]
MSSTTAAPEILNREFLEMRAKILELAAALDRIDRADGSVAADPRVQRIEQGLAVLAEAGAGRAEKVQMIFSLAYQEGWQSEIAL